MKIHGTSQRSLIFKYILILIYWWESQKERHHWEDQDIGGWIILTWILER
jgi:hypothetical protein